MYVAGALVAVKENLSCLVAQEVTKLSLAEVPNVAPSNSFCCVIEANCIDEIESKILQIKSLDNVISVEKTFLENEDECDFN